jgi:cell division inhibitor SepF
MGLKKFWNNVVGKVSGVDEDDIYETDEDFEDDDDEIEDAPRQNQRPVAAAQVDRPLKMMIVEPESFDDSQSIADFLRDRKPVVINFESTEPDISKRVVDFVSGATYALDGNIQKVGKDIFLCVPSNVTVDRSKHDYGDFTAQLAWKNGEGNKQQ